MKKVYCSPEWEILVMEEDLITTSEEYVFGDDFKSDDSIVESWEW